MKPQKRKCSSENYYDRLSEMPDEVIVHILSYLPIVDAVRTILIRRFGNLWTLVPTLKFEAEEFIRKIDPDGKLTCNNIRRFYVFVRNVLMLHNRPFIDKFYLCLRLSDDGRLKAGKYVRMSLRFALDKQAKEIYFSDVTYDIFFRSSDFPNFTSQSLVTLELWNCSIYPQLQVNLGSLVKLTLCEMEMCEEALRQFLCGCPSLQELHIEEPYCIKNFNFSAPNISKLSLDLVEDGKSDDLWSLDFPNLKSLDLGIDRIPDVIDVSSVRDIHLKRFHFDKDDENEIRLFKLFLEKFSCTEVFQLSCNASEPFLHSIDDSHRLQIRWKRLVLHMRRFCQSCLLGVYQLMRNSTHLEELIIYTDTSLRLTPSLFCCLPSIASADMPRVELTDPCVMPKLRTVALHGYAKACKHQLQLVEFLLKNATVLEKLVIVPNKPQLTVKEKLDKLDFVTHVSSFQRSSPSARVLFL